MKDQKEDVTYIYRFSGQGGNMRFAVAILPGDVVTQGKVDEIMRILKEEFSEGIREIRYLFDEIKNKFCILIKCSKLRVSRSGFAGLCKRFGKVLVRSNCSSSTFISGEIPHALMKTFKIA